MYASGVFAAGYLARPVGVKALTGFDRMTAAHYVVALCAIGAGAALLKKDSPATATTDA